MNLTSSEQREYDAELNFMSILFHHIELLECTIIQDEYFQFKDFRKLFSLLKQHKEVNAGQCRQFKRN
ncbi:MAG: hypothetical protein LUG12_10015 [Erysipelotrichaceae bacterium]|nr:hypothetical protein [Erysipelotrichaceae bacterium]